MDKDVIYCYQEMIRNIRIVEDNEEDNEALENVRESFFELFEYIKMFLISKKERYYGYFLMDFTITVDFTANYCAGVSIDKYPFEMTINPLLLGEYSIKEIICIICHEIEHIVLDHPAHDRRINPDKDSYIHELLNDAMDASINDRLIWDINARNIDIMSFPEDGITSKVLSEEYEKHLKKLQDFLYYYSQMPKNKPNCNKKLQFLEGDCVIMSKNGKAIVTNKNRPQKVLHIWTEEGDANDVHEIIKNYVKQVVDGIPNENRSKFPEYQNEAINALLAPPAIDWCNVLKRYIGMTPYLYRRTKTRLNRRQPERYDISGRIVNREVRVVVAIDTSGSLDGEELKKIFTEIFSILKNTKFELTVIECDAEVQSVYKARNIDEINLDVNGRGGTSFEPVISYLNEKKEYRDAVLIYFTDGMGDDEISRPMVNRCLWVLTDLNSELSVEEPYGDVIRMECDC